MIYVGIDVHKSYCVATALDKHGNTIAENKFPNSKENIHTYIKQLPNQEKKAVIEASTTMYQAYNNLTSAGVQTIVANPAKVKAIASAKIKTDKIDSKTLAQLLRTNLIPTCHIPSNNTRQIRKLCRHRVILVKQRTQTKNAVHALLTEQGIKHKFSDLFGNKGKKFLQTLGLSEESKLVLDTHLSILNTLEEQIDKVSKHIAQTALENKNVQLLMTIPGIGYYTALSIVTEIDNINRFADANKLCAWAGLIPSTRQSGNKCYHGKITKQGNKLTRWVIIQATQQTVRYDNPLKQYFQHLHQRKGRNKAIVATAKKTIRIMHAMLTTQQPYWYVDKQLVWRKHLETRRIAGIYFKKPRKKHTNRTSQSLS